MNAFQIVLFWASVVCFQTDIVKSQTVPPRTTPWTPPPALIKAEGIARGLGYQGHGFAKDVPVVVDRANTEMTGDMLDFTQLVVKRLYGTILDYKLNYLSGNRTHDFARVKIAQAMEIAYPVTVFQRTTANARWVAKDTQPRSANPAQTYEPGTMFSATVNNHCQLVIYVRHKESTK